MSSFSKLLLSGSTNGRPIKIAATATPGTLVHTAHATDLDEIWLWVGNTDTVSRQLKIEFGGTTSPDDIIIFYVPAESGSLLVVPGLILTGGVVLRVFAATTNVMNVTGFVNRISP
jgi:hypothetical protein